MVALRSSLWKILSSGEQNDYLKALIGEHALGYRTTVVAVENESDQGLIQAKLNRLGREDVLLTVVPNLYTSKEQSIILEVGSLERGVLSRIPFEGYSLYEVIASPCEPNMKGVSTASALHHAMVRFINRAMEIVEEGSFAEIDLAIKTAALAALQS